MSFGYLNKINNKNLDELIGISGYFEVNDPEMVSVFNSYPDDSKILRNLLYNFSYINEILYRYNSVYSEIITGNHNLMHLQRHLPVYQHLTGSGPKVIVGILEVNSVNDFINEDHKNTRNDFTHQIFHRLNDEVSFQRFYNGYNWTEWSYIHTTDTYYLTLADGITMNKIKAEIRNAIASYAPRYDDSAIKQAILSKVTKVEFDRKLKKENANMSGTLTLTGGPGVDGELANNVKVDSGNLIIDTDGNLSGLATYVVNPTPSNFPHKLLSVESGPNLRIGHKWHSRTRFINESRGGHVQYTSNIFWNDPNNLDNEIQHLGRLQHRILDGIWPKPQPGSWLIDYEKMEDLLVVHSNSRTNYHVGRGAFIWPLCTRENVDLTLTTPDVAYGNGAPMADTEARVSLYFSNNAITINPLHVSFTAYIR